MTRALARGARPAGLPLLHGEKHEYALRAGAEGRFMTGKVRVYFLGTAGSTFTSEDVPPCIFVGGYLLDCPAPCPHLLAQHGLLDKVHTVLLTHMHVDHSLGVYDLAWHLGTVLSQRKLRLLLPEGDAQLLHEGFRVLGGRLAEKLASFFDVEEVEDGRDYGGVRAVKARHSVPAVGYRVELEGSSVCYTGDTAPSERIIEVFRGCTLLVHDATYPPGEEERAAADGHSTPLQAAQVALQAGAGVLALVHLPYARLGKRVKEEFLDAARRVFPSTIVPDPEQVVELGGRTWRLL